MIGRRTLLVGVGATAIVPRGLAAAPLATTAAGRVSGRIENGVIVFRGIRYGTAARFQPARAPALSRDTVAAVAFGPSCPQPRPPGGASEDCLVLNVWTPDLRARRPVIVYIHGGGYTSGSGGDPLTDGGRLAARGDVVVVTLNHRLGPFGYLSLGRLDPAFADSGNLGQLDLILALQWVRANIAAFGGDPARVTLVGQSGGGAKIATLMGTPAARGLFGAAVTMSGQQVTAAGPLHATARARAFLAAAKVDRPRDLLALPAARLVEAMAARDPILDAALSFAPVVDGRTLVRHPFWPDAHPQSTALPMILGNTHDETRGFFDPAAPPYAGMTWDALPAMLAHGMPIDIAPETVIADYRHRVPGIAPADLFFAATTAGRSWRGQVEEAEARARAGAATWVYQLDFAAPLAPQRRAYHTLDIPLVFGTLDAPGSTTGTGAAARAVSAAMMAMVAGLAHGRPPAWPRYDLDRRATMIFDTASRVVDDPRGDERRLFATVPYTQPGT